MKNLKKFNDAIQNYDEAIQLSQGADVEDIYYFKGNCLLELNKFEEAIQLYD